MKKPHLISLLSASLALGVAHADVTLGTPFRDGAVLQRDKPVVVWGGAAPGEAVEVEFAGRAHSTAHTRADAKGHWRVELAAMPASASPGKLTVHGHNVVTISDVVVGDVWLCSGQSNMMMAVRQVNDAAKEMGAANYPLIRHFTVKSVVSESPLLQVEGDWQATTPENVREFTATGYFFALNLQRELGVPIGLIKATLGGSPIEGWMSPEALASDPAFGIVYKRWDEMKDRIKGNVGARRNMPSGLYNGLIVPMEPYTLKGILWYQGEANYRYHQEYGLLFRTMITQWRRDFQQGDLPFLFVQLPGFDEPTDPTKQGWAWRREEQASVLNLPKVSMAVAVDIGDPHDIHPKNKQEIGRRLALVALKDFYGRDVQARGPVLEQATREGGSFRLRFRNADGLELIGDPHEAFLVAGENRTFLPADAKIEGNDVVVSAAAIGDPVAVRFEWANNPTAFLVNRAKLPAAPFRTDHWQ